MKDILYYPPNSSPTASWWNRFVAYLTPRIAGDVLGMGDGAVGAPAYSFALDFDTGMYRIGANNIGFAVGGAQIVGIEAGNLDVDVPIYNIDGAAGTPSYTFDADVNTGMYRNANDVIGFAAGGAGIALITNDATAPQILLVDGSDANPAYSFISDRDMGMYRIGADNIGFAVNNTLVMGIETTNIDIDLPIYAADGAVGAPSYSFDSDTDTGMYRFGANTIGLTTNGVIRQTISTTEIQDVLIHYFVDGAVGAPSMAFSGDPDTGFYRIGANNFGVSTGGALIMGFETTNIDVDVPIYAANGAVGTPSYSFDADTDCGMYYSATQLNWAVAGVQEMYLDGTRLTVNGECNIATGQHYEINSIDVFSIDGTSNILLGDCAANYTGSYGVAIGAGSMGDSGAGCSGDYNFALGYNCLTACTSGNQNIGIGAQCFNTLNTGIFNCSVGTNSSYSMTSARYNTAVGFQALYTVLTEWGNVGIGFNAGRYYRGQYSVLIGYEAGRGGAGATYTGADYNVCIGYGAGWSMITNQDHCVFLGNNAGYYETADDKLFIDNRARTNLATGRLEAMIYGIFNATATSQELRFNASVYIKEGPAGGNTDYAGYGQLYCKDNAGTTELWFVDDAGAETQLA